MTTPTDAERHLIALGTTLMQRLWPEAPLASNVLPDGLGVAVFEMARGGGTVYVAPDETVLFVASAIDPAEGLAQFRSGRRTPKDKFSPTQ